jgi:hypothetical protein
VFGGPDTSDEYDYGFTLLRQRLCAAFYLQLLAQRFWELQIGILDIFVLITRDWFIVSVQFVFD